MQVTYKCLVCGTEIHTDEIYIKNNKDRYVACIFGHSKVVKVSPYEGLEECMKHDSYEKKNRRVKQRGWG